jgi:deoxyribose-phosphate aldolase
MKLSARDISRMIDVSAVKTEDSETEVRNMAATARENGCAAVFALPHWTPLAIELLKGDTVVAPGGAVGFPSGGQTTMIKVAETRELRAMGCTEIDMVISIGRLISGRRAEVLDDIRAVVAESGPLPVKVILECHYLNEEQILTGCDLCVEAGARWIKTGTGLAPTGATPENVALIKRHVGDAIGVKAAGGVRGLETLLALYRNGARRFGLGWKGARTVLARVRSLGPEGVEV